MTTRIIIGVIVGALAGSSAALAQSAGACPASGGGCCASGTSWGELFQFDPAEVDITSMAAPATFEFQIPSILSISTDDQPEAHSHISMMRTDDTGEYSVTIKNGIMSAKVNGKDVPTDRIRRTDDQVSILDEQGQEICTFTLSLKGSPRTAIRVGPGGPEFLKDLEHLKLIPRDGMTIQGLDEAGVRRLMQEHLGVATTNPPRAMLGVTMSEADETLASNLGVSRDQVVVIERVVEGLPAAEAGLKAADVIVGIDGQKGATQEKIREILRTRNPGDKVVFRVLREGEKKEVGVTLKAYDGAKLGMATTTVTGEPLDNSRVRIREFLGDDAQREIKRAIEEAMRSAGDSKWTREAQEKTRKALEEAMRAFEESSGQVRAFVLPEGASGRWQGLNDPPIQGHVQDRARLEDQLQRNRDEMDAVRKELQEIKELVRELAKQRSGR